MEVLSTMANNQQGPKYDMRGATFSGGFAEKVEGDQIDNSSSQMELSEDTNE